MKFDKTYSCIISSYKVATKSIKTPEDEKIQKRYGSCKIEADYFSGDLSEFISGNTPDDIEIITATWDERIGTYSLNINDVIFPVKIVKIERKNKEDAAKFSLTFETEELEKFSGISHYVKDKDNLAQVTLSKLED